MASYPNYDPNIFAEPMDLAEWAKLDKRGHPFMNRAISVYPPGSTFKVVTLSGALMENAAKLSETFDCKGTFRLGNRVAKCWREEGHGVLNILEALVWSCDVVFYELGLRDGPSVMSRYAFEYGLGKRTGIDLPSEADGFIPTEDWKKRALGEPWVRGDSINMAIGQGFIQVTPLQMADLYSGIAAGKRFRPYVVKNVFDRDGSVIFSAEAIEIGGIPISGKNLDLLRSALRAVIARGTGIAAKVQGIPAAGKTGTAENPGKAHAWFMCYAPYENPEIAIVSFVAQGEHGDRASAYIARDILNWYKKNRLKAVIDEPDFNWNQYIKHGAYSGKLL
jgi:penicillin-binding protein 2